MLVIYSVLSNLLYFVDAKGKERLSSREIVPFSLQTVHFLFKGPSLSLKSQFSVF